MNEKGNRLKDAELSAWFFQKEASGLKKQVAALEEALAVSADELLSYKDYYGTSPAQVKHLAECTKCLPLECMSDERCPDYPSE